MLIIDSIIESVRDIIAQGASDSQTVTAVSYEKNLIANPLRKTYIILNPSKITVLPYHDDYGIKTKQVDFLLSVNIHRSEQSDPKMLLRVFSETLTSLDESSLYSIEEAACGEIKSDADTNSIFLPCTFKFSVLC